jgi:hypothetical protein
MRTEIKMRIAVVSTGRNRCTLLAKYLHAAYEDLEFCGEFYNSGRDADGNPTDPGEIWQTCPLADKTLVELTDELFAKENYVVKIIATSLTRAEFMDPAVFRLAEYDQIHFIERPDFFEHCCSWEVSLKEQVFHLTNNDESEKKFAKIRNSTYKMSASMIEYAATHVDYYLKIKKYVIDNHIPHSVHTYESAKMFDKTQDELIDSNLNYSELVTNYHQLKEEVNRLFNQYFSYSDITSDLTSFKAAINDVPGIRSMQSFANKMAAKWNKQKN